MESRLIAALVTTLTVSIAGVSRGSPMPIDLTVEPIAPGSIQLTWPPSSSAEEFRIFRTTDGQSHKILVGMAPSGSKGFVDSSGLAPHTIFGYRVDALDGSGSLLARGEASARSTGVSSSSTLKPINEGLPRSLDKDSSLRAPDAITLNDGHRLMVAYTVGSAEDSCDIVAQVSTDGGNDWSKPFALLDQEESIGKPEFYRMSDSLIGMTYSKWVDGVPFRAFRRTGNDGMTWSDEVLIAKGYSGRNSSGCVADRGRLITVLASGGNSKKHAVSVAWSDDQGSTWSPPILVSPKPLGEAAAVHAGHGRILILTRSKMDSEPFYHLFESFDNGDTWTERPASHAIWGGSDNPPEISRIPDSDTLIAIVNGFKTTDIKTQKNRRHTYALKSIDWVRSWEFLGNVEYFKSSDSKFDDSQAANFSLVWHGQVPVLITGNDGSLHPQGANGEATELRYISIRKLSL